MSLLSARKAIIVLAITTSSIGIIFSQVVAYSTQPGNPENGRRWYAMNNCTSCHGEGGKNGRAPEIAGLKLGFGSFLKHLREPDSVSKPNYSEEDISKQDAADMYVWLKENQ